MDGGKDKYPDFITTPYINMYLVCFIMRDRKRRDLEERRGGEELEGVGK